MNLDHDTGTIDTLQALDTTVVPPLGGTAGLLTVIGTGGILTPKGTTGQRPSIAEGLIRYNTSLHAFEFAQGSSPSWGYVGTVTSLSGTANQITISNPTLTPVVSIANNAVLPGTGAMTVVTGTNAQRPSAAEGLFRYNTSTHLFEFGQGSPATWVNLGTGGGGGGGFGTVTYVDVDGSTTGLTFTGGPITTSGTLTLGGTLGLGNGGTNSSLTADNGGIVYSGSSSLQILASTSTAQKLLMSGASSAPSWSTATYPASTTANAILYSSSTNVVSQLTLGSPYQVLRVNSAGTAPVYGAVDLSQSAAATGILQNSSMPALSGDVTNSVGSVAMTISTHVVGNSKLTQVATKTFKGRTSALTGDVEDLTATQATAMLDAMVGDSGSGGTKGLVPTPAIGDASKVLSGAGTWISASTGTVSSVSVVTANGFSGSVATSTTTPAITITTTITGMLKGNGTSISAASSSTDYQLPITAGDVTTSGATSTIGVNKVLNSMLDQMPANTIKGNNTGSTANAIDLTITQLNGMINSTVAPVFSNITSKPTTLSGYGITDGETTFTSTLGISAAGTNQGTATTLTQTSDFQVYELTTVGSGQGVALPLVTGSFRCVIKNTGASTVNVYPNNTGTIDGSVNQFISSGKIMEFFCVNGSDRWYSLKGQGFLGGSPAALGTAAAGTSIEGARSDHVHPSADLSTSQVTGTLAAARFPALTGDVTNTVGTLATTVVKVNGVLLSALSTGLLKNTTGTGAPSIAVAGVDYISPVNITDMQSRMFLLMGA